MKSFMGKYDVRNKARYKWLCILTICSLIMACAYLEHTENHRIFQALEKNILVSKYSVKSSTFQMQLEKYLPDVVTEKFKTYKVNLKVNRNTKFRYESEHIKDVSSLDYYESDLYLLETILRNNRQLNSLSIDNITTSDVLPLLIEYCPNLESLTLLDINDNDKELIYSLKSLKYLYVESDGYLENKSLRISEQLLLREPEAFPHFAFLDFTNAKNISDELLARVIRSRKSFLRIYLPGDLVGNETTEALLAHELLKKPYSGRCSCSWRGITIDGAISKENAAKIYDLGLRTLRLDYDQRDAIYDERNPKKLTKVEEKRIRLLEEELQLID